MGIRWVFESKQMRAFWLTFLFPFIGGFLYSRQWGMALFALIASPVLIILMFLILSFVQFEVFPQVSFCDEAGTKPDGGGFGMSRDGCVGERRVFDAAELRHNEIYDLVFQGILPLTVVFWLVIFGALAAAGVREQPDSDAEDKSRTIWTKFEAIRAKFKNGKIDAAKYGSEVGKLVARPPDGIGNIIVKIRRTTNQDIESAVGRISSKSEHE